MNLARTPSGPATWTTVSASEFTDPLAAAAARGGEVFAVADDADFGDAALAGLSHGGDCARLGADSVRIGGVLDISARIDRAASCAATPIAKPDSPAGP